jgi:hypothetical protein
VFRTTELAAGKNLFRSVALVVAATPAVYQASRAYPGDIELGLSSLWPSISAVGVTAMIFSALGPGALSAVLQTYAQRTVSAPVAQVLLLPSALLWCSGAHLENGGSTICAPQRVHHGY